MAITAYVGCNVGPFGKHPLVIRLAFIPGIIGSELSLHYTMFMSSTTLFLWKIELFESFYYLNRFSLGVMVLSSLLLLRNYISGFKFENVSKQVIDQFYSQTNPKSRSHHKSKSQRVKNLVIKGKTLDEIDQQLKESSRPKLPKLLIRPINLTNLLKSIKLLPKNLFKLFETIYKIKTSPSNETKRERSSSHLEEPNKFSLFYWFKLLIPIPSLHFPSVHRIKDIPYANDDEFQRLDLFFHSSCPSHRPILVYVHGGGWKVGGGKRSTCGLPLKYQMASKHWLVFSIGYRLAPDNKFPTHMCDIKKAVTWIRENAAFYGGDIDSMFIAGGSAGGHLASLTALTDGIDYDELFNNNPTKDITQDEIINEQVENVNIKEVILENVEIKEEKEIGEVETKEEDKLNVQIKKVQSTPSPPPTVIEKKTYPKFRGCVSYYAVYDFTNRDKAWTFDFPFYLGDVIMRNTIENEPELYKNGSPIDHLKETTRVPFLVFHGDHDELVPFKESVQFVEKYRELAGKGAKVTWMPVPGAHHAFDLLFSPRTIYSVYNSYRYLNRLYKLHQHEKLKLKLSIQQKEYILSKKAMEGINENDLINTTINNTSTPSV